MRYLKLFENFDDNKEVVDALKKILNCIKNGKKITSVLNGGTLMDLHDNCSDEQVMNFLSKASEVAGEEIQGTQVDLKNQFDANELEGLIRILEGNPEKAEPKMELELSESLDSFHHISEDEYNQFSQVPVLGELITKSKVKLEKDRIFYDENDVETKEILDQYLEIPDKVEESITLKKIKKFNQFLNENIELSNSSTRIYIDSDEADMFKTEPALQKLVSDKKVSILLPELWFESEDKSTIDTLKRYFPDAEFNIEEDEEEEDDSEDFDDYYY